MVKEWKFNGIIRCSGRGCDEFPQCSGDLNRASTEFNCEFEFEGQILEVKNSYPVKRNLPVSPIG